MDSVNQTLYIPLYGKAYVTKKGVILNDQKAVDIWEKEGFLIKGKSKSKMLAYYMAMRAKVFDQWVVDCLKDYPSAIVLHIGCGLDNRYGRINPSTCDWYDIDFEDVISVRKKYYNDSENYHMLSYDMRDEKLFEDLKPASNVIVVMEGISMYVQSSEIQVFFEHLANRFENIHLLLDAYSEFAAKMSKYKNPINEVGVYEVYGIDHPEKLNIKELSYRQSHLITPNYLIDELSGLEKMIFKKLYAGKFSSRLYYLYEFRK